MVDKIEVAWVLGFGLLIGGFFGFVLSHGDWVYGGVGAVVLVVISLVYAVMFGEAGESETI